MNYERFEELESKDLLSLEEFKELGHLRIQQLLEKELAC